MSAKKKIKSVKAWAGVCDGKIHLWHNCDPKYYEIYTSKKVASEHYDHVIPVLITSIKKARP